MLALAGLDVSRHVEPMSEGSADVGEDVADLRESLSSPRRKGGSSRLSRRGVVKHRNLSTRPVPSIVPFLRPHTRFCPQLRRVCRCRAASAVEASGFRRV